MRYGLVKRIPDTDNLYGLFPAEWEAGGRKKINIIEGSEPIIAGENKAGGIWFDMMKAGWEWVQVGSFGPRVWQAKA